MQAKGTVVPMATPMSGRTGDLDVDALEEFTRFLVDKGVYGLFPGSSIGEFSSLSDDQLQRLIQTVTRVADDDVTVYAGCGDTNLDGVVTQTQQAADNDADMAVVVSPYYLDTKQTGLTAFFETVADRSPLPVLLYNIPSLTGNSLSVDTVTTLADHDNIVGMKDTSKDLTYHHDVITRTPEAFRVFQGATELALGSLNAGADGIVAGPANVFPSELTDLYDAHQTGDHEKAVSIMQDLVTPLVSATADIPTAVAIKFLIAQNGINIGEPVLPLPTLEEDEREQLLNCYQRVAGRVERSTINQ